jgi:hypothetical protein
VASNQPRPVVQAVLKVTFELKQDRGLLAGGGRPATLADDAAGEAGPGGAMQPPVMAFETPILGIWRG